MASFYNQDQQSEDRKILSILESINGTMVNYYYVCPRKLWLFSRGLGREQDSPLVKLGKLIHEQSFSRQEHEHSIFGRINIDFTTSGEVLIIHEIKKTKSQSHAARAQTLFYLYIMERLGVACRGEIHYRSEKRRITVELDEVSKISVEEMLEKIYSIITSDTLPKIPARVPCSKCAYKDYCRM